MTTKDYVDGLISTYKNEVIEWVTRYLQIYTILGGSGMTISVNPTEFQANDSELSDKFRILINQKNLSTLFRPSGGTIEFVYNNIDSRKVILLAKGYRKVSTEVNLAIDLYKNGLRQLESISQYLLYFIPLEILVWRYIKESDIPWKKDYPREYEKLERFINKVLSNRIFEKKKSSLLTRLPHYTFIEALEKYFRNIFSKREIKRFWNDTSDVTENGRWIWDQYAKILKSGIPENADLFNVMVKLNNIRNDIVHEGLKEVQTEHIFLIENILRRVIKKELMKRN